MIEEEAVIAVIRAGYEWTQVYHNPDHMARVQASEKR